MRDSFNSRAPKQFMEYTFEYGLDGTAAGTLGAAENAQGTARPWNVRWNPTTGIINSNAATHVRKYS